jgi:hypothetical protein
MSRYLEWDSVNKIQSPLTRQVETTTLSIAIETDPLLFGKLMETGLKSMRGFDEPEPRTEEILDADLLDQTN